MRELAVARHHFDLTPATLSVLEALLSFLPGSPDETRDAGSGVVYPSNRALSLRTKGLSESSLRRHIAKLERCGVLRRIDSPNGKRFPVRMPGAAGSGEIIAAYGFDLAPLWQRNNEIRDAAQATRERDAAWQSLRRSVSLKLRDLEVMADAMRMTGHELGYMMQARIDEIGAAVRRVRRRRAAASYGALEHLDIELSAVIESLEMRIAEADNDARSQDELVDNHAIQTAQCGVTTVDLHGSAVHSDCLHQNSTKNPILNFPDNAGGTSPIKSGEDESATNLQRRGPGTNQEAQRTRNATSGSTTDHGDHNGSSADPSADASGLPPLPFSLVRDSFSALSMYVPPQGLTRWAELLALAEPVRRDIGISEPVWRMARASMGDATAALAVLCLLERFGEIRCCSAYLRNLAQRADKGELSIIAIVMAIVRRAR